MTAQDKKISGWRWIESLPTRWGSMSIVHATLKGLRVILRDPTIDFIYLLSGTDIPIVSEAELILQTIGTRFYCTTMMTPEQEVLFPSSENKTSCGFSPQWMLWSRKDAEATLAHWDANSFIVNNLKSLHKLYMLSHQSVSDDVWEQDLLTRIQKLSQRRNRLHRTQLYTPAHLTSIDFEMENLQKQYAEQLDNKQYKNSSTFVQHGHPPDEWFLQNLLFLIITQKGETHLNQPITGIAKPRFPMFPIVSPFTWYDTETRAAQSLDPTDKGWTLFDYIVDAQSSGHLFFRKVGSLTSEQERSLLSFIHSGNL